MNITKVPYGELMKYRNKLQPIYSYPSFKHEYPLILSELAPKMKIVDFGCGRGNLYNEALLPNNFSGEYVGIDNDPSLVTNFPLFKDVDEFIIGRRIREFDALIMLNIMEHMKLEEAYTTIKTLNPYIDNKIIIMTPNPLCFDYMFVDPQHTTFYSYEFLYGLCKHFDFEKVQIWRGKGYHALREDRMRREPNKADEMRSINEFQERICLAMGLDWFGNLLVIGERSDD